MANSLAERRHWQADSTATELKPLQGTTRRRSETYGDESDNVKDMKDSDLHQPENVDIEHGETNEEPMQNRNACMGTENLRCSGSCCLLMLATLLLRGYAASLHVSLLHIYSRDFLKVLDVPYGTENWMTILKKAFSLIAGKENYYSVRGQS